MRSGVHQSVFRPQRESGTLLSMKPHRPQSELPDGPITDEERRERLRDYVRIMIDVWKNLAVDDDAWQRYCTLTGRDPARTMRPIDPFRRDRNNV